MEMFAELPTMLRDLDTALLEQLPAGLCVCRAPHGEIIRHNAAAMRLWGRTPAPGERVTGAWRTRRPDGRLMPPDESPMALVLQGGPPIRGEHLIIERGNGTTVTVAASVSPLHDDQGRVVAAISAFEEVGADAHRQADQAALYVERRQRNTFVASLAHEVRQPLSALLAAVDVLRLAPNVAATDRATAIMTRQIVQMNRLVDDLLDGTRWASGKVTLQKRRLDVRDVVAEAALDVGASVAARGQHLTVATAAVPLWADADKLRLHQVLANLLHNAVKFTRPGGRITLAAEDAADGVRLRVGDTGRGIEPDALVHIFDLFAQVGPSEDTGLGVGLSVVREIVMLHEGRVEARSDGPEQGSEFVVMLPRAPAPSAPAGEP